jgi:hypothetical protein
MVATQKSLRLVVYAPALLGDDGRPLAIVHGMERAIPGLRLTWTTTENEDLIALPHRDEWVATDRTDNGFPFLCNDDENCPVTLAGWENARGLAADMTPHFEVHATLPQNETGIAAAADALEAVAEGARAIWGRVLSDGVAATVAQQFRHQGDEPHIPPKGLPLLELSWDIAAPEVPHYLGWLNYWSAAAARAIGFPDPVRDTELRSRARRTATGGWIVQLTDAPLDLENPAHLETLLRAYERFPVVGGRSAP